jgi:hypothetical protein
VKLTFKVPEVVVIESIVGALGGWETSTLVKVGAVNVKEELLVAKSRKVPLFKSIEVPIAIPFVSRSLMSLATVYLNTREFVPDPEK